MKTKITEKSLRPTLLEKLQTSIKSRLHDKYLHQQENVHAFIVGKIKHTQSKNVA